MDPTTLPMFGVSGSPSPNSTPNIAKPTTPTASLSLAILSQILHSSPIGSNHSTSSFSNFQCQRDYNPFRSLNINIFSTNRSETYPEPVKFLAFTEQELFIINVCFIISSIFLVLSLLVYVLVAELRTVPGRCMMGLVFSELVLNWCIMAMFGLQQRNLQGTQICAVVGVFAHYFFLSIICWANVIAYDLLRKIKCPTRKLHNFIRYVYFAYLTPFLVIVVALSLEYTLSNQSPFCSLRPHYGLRLCGLSTDLSSMVFAVIPLLFTVLLNFFTLMYAIYRIKQSLSENISFGKLQDSVWTRFVLYGKLFILLGIFFLFGFLGVLVNYCHLVNLISILISSLHGAGIFMVFTFKKSVLRKLSRRLQTWKLGREATIRSKANSGSGSQHHHNLQHRKSSASKNSFSVTIHFQTPTPVNTSPPPPPIRI